MRIGIIGGSISGAALAILLSRQGHDVHVYERTAGFWKERGGGIVLPVGLVRQLHEMDLFDASIVGIRPSQQTWVTRDANNPNGRVLWTQPLGGLEAYQWGNVYGELARRNNKAAITYNVNVEKSSQTADKATLHFKDGKTEDFDLVIAADGYRSATRAALFPEAKAAYSGYVAWRGIVHEREIADIGPIEDQISWPVMESGIAPCYFVPGEHGETAVGQRRLNWLWYDASAPDDVINLRREADGSIVVPSIAPGEATEKQKAYVASRAREQLPTWHAEIYANSPYPYLQPVYDLELKSYHAGRIAILGDAACIARPHTASGATKALDDAIALAQALADNADLAAALKAYDAVRVPAGQAIVDLGRACGHDQVTSAPDWTKMTPENFEDWYKTTALGGLYYHTS